MATRPIGSPGRRTPLPVEASAMPDMFLVACLSFLRTKTIVRVQPTLFSAKPAQSQSPLLRHPTSQVPSRCVRSFSTSAALQDWLTPARPEVRKSHVGRPRMPTGGSMRGTTVVWGDYGLRMKDHDRRVSASRDHTHRGTCSSGRQCRYAG